MVSTEPQGEKVLGGRFSVGAPSAAFVCPAMLRCLLGWTDDHRGLTPSLGLV